MSFKTRIYFAVFGTIFLFLFFILRFFFESIIIYLGLNDSLIYINFITICGALDETLFLLLVSLPIGFILSLIFALARVSKNKILSKTIEYYIFVIRGTPLLVQIYLIYQLNIILYATYDVHIVVKLIMVVKDQNIML